MRASSSGTLEPVKDDAMVEFVHNLLLDYCTMHYVRTKRRSERRLDGVIMS